MNEPHRESQSHEVQRSSHCVKYVMFALCAVVGLVGASPSILQIGEELLVKYRLRQDLKGLRELHVIEHIATFAGNDRQVVSAANVLAKYPHITTLQVYGRDTTDEALRAISEMKSLDTLIINDAQISDEGLQMLCNLQKLRILDLSRCKQITDQGILHLSCLRQLRILDLFGTKVTEGCLEPLLTANPSLKNAVNGVPAQRSQKGE